MGQQFECTGKITDLSQCQSDTIKAISLSSTYNV